MRLRTLIPVTAAVGAAAAGYATVVERNWFALRRFEIPVLPPGAAPLRVLHISDAHLTPGRKRLMSWMRDLDDLDPHLIVNTGDCIAHPEAIRCFLDSLGPLLDRPGVFVFRPQRPVRAQAVESAAVPAAERQPRAPRESHRPALGKAPRRHGRGRLARSEQPARPADRGRTRHRVRRRA